MTENMARLTGAACGLLVAVLLGCHPIGTAHHASDQETAHQEGHARTEHGDSHDDHEHDHDEHGAAHDDHGHTHEPAEGPQSFHDAVAQLKDIQDQVRTAMESDDPDAAHGPLHNVGHVLNKIPDLAADTDLAESEWNEVNAEVDRLFEAFGDVDASFHDDGDKQAAYESAKSTIEEGIASLEAKLALLGEDSESSYVGHDEEHEEHAHGNEDDHDHDHE